MTDRGTLRVWHVPQVPGKAFQREVPNLEVAALLMRSLADYDLFQFENRIKPDYANVQGLQVYDPETADPDDPQDDGWTDWHCQEGESFTHHLRMKTDLATLVWEGESPHSSEHIIALVGREGADALFRDALSGFVTEPPPPWAQAWAGRIGDGSGADRLQEWVCLHLRRDWMTGIGAIEAAEQMIEESMCNGNLADPVVLEEVTGT